MSQELFDAADHADMVDSEIARQAALMAGLTREDAEIMAADRLNPGFGLSILAEDNLLHDRRDAALMATLGEIKPLVTARAVHFVWAFQGGVTWPTC